MKLRAHHALAAALVCVLALALTESPAFSQTNTTNVQTPSGAAHGSLTSGNVPVATGGAGVHNQISDSGKSPPTGAFVGTTDAQALSNKNVTATGTFTARRALGPLRRGIR